MRIIQIRYRELSRECGSLDYESLPSILDVVSDAPAENQVLIIEYLKNAPNYGAMGKVVGDALDTRDKTLLFPGTNTDGLYLWPLELPHYVRKYHVRLPSEFVQRMVARNWLPPLAGVINWKKLHQGQATDELV